MPLYQDVTFDVLNKIRDAGVRRDATIYLSRPDADRVVAGLTVVDSDIQGAETLHFFSGVEDEYGSLKFLLDDSLPRGVARVEGEMMSPSLVSLVGTI